MSKTQVLLVAVAVSMSSLACQRGEAPAPVAEPAPIESAAQAPKAEPAETSPAKAEAPATKESVPAVEETMPDRGAGQSDADTE